MFHLGTEQGTPLSWEHLPVTGSWNKNRWLDKPARLSFSCSLDLLLIYHQTNTYSDIRDGDWLSTVDSSSKILPFCGRTQFLFKTVLRRTASLLKMVDVHNSRVNFLLLLQKPLCWKDDLVSKNSLKFIAVTRHWDYQISNLRLRLYLDVKRFTTLQIGSNLYLHPP